MIAMKITIATATRVHRMIAASGTAAIALHDARVQLTAIAPYGDRHLMRCIDVLVMLASKTPETQDRLIGQLAGLVKGV